ncbi:MAG: helix-turn-helix domain-containing protein [Marinicella sp.]
MEIIFVLAAAQAFFLTALNTTKKHRVKADRILSLWLFLLGLHLLINALYLQFNWQNFLLLNFSAGFPFIQGPMLFLYIRTLTAVEARIKAIDVLHFFPIVGFFLYQILVLNGYSLAEGGEQKFQHIFSMPVIFNVLLLTSVPVYSLLSLNILKKYQQTLLERFAEVETINLNWLKILTKGLLAIWLVVLILFVYVRFYSDQQQNPIGHVLFMAVAVYLYVIGYFGLTQTNMFIGDIVVVGNKLTEKDIAEPHNEKVKYLKSSLTQDDIELIGAQLTEYMQQHNPHLDDGITLYSLAQQLDVSAHHLSQVINERSQQNFFEFINAYRIETVINKIKHPDFVDTSLLNLAFESGFGSKSTFNRLFKKHTGLTPSEFRQQNRDSSIN